MLLTELNTESFSLDNFLRDCKPWLTEVGNNIAFRGVKKPDDFSKVNPRTNRRALNTPQNINDALDKAFAKKYDGIKPRSNGVFVTSREQVAKMYGVPCAIFPIGDFKSIWSPRILDMFEEWRDFKGMESDRYDENDKWFVEKFVAETVVDEPWKIDDTAGGLKSIAEMVIISKSYYQFKCDSELWLKEVLPKIKAV